MSKCLFFLCLCLVFSSTFTSQNPIELPTVAPRLIRDADGKAVNTRTSYRIVSTYRGAAGGDVYLGPSPNSTGPCDDGVYRYNSDVGPSGMPVKFIKFDNSGSRIFENHDINIYFDIVTTKLCVIYRNWKVGDYDVSLGARLLETGGTTSQQDSSWFKIVKDLTTTKTYNLYYCPGPFACPSCPIDECQAVGQVFQDGKRRLALVKDQPLGWAFQKVEESTILPAATMF